MTRPLCGQCQRKPPRSGQSCSYEDDFVPTHQTSAEMQKTIGRLRNRLDELERNPGPLSQQVVLRQPYQGHRTSTSHEPSPNVRNSLIETFLNRFANGVHFFLDARQFAQTMHNPPSPTNSQRPSAALIQTVYLWGCILSGPTPLSSAEEFLLSALEYLPADLNRLGADPHSHQSPLMLDTIQTTVLLALYYMHEGLPVQGRYHASAAASLAISAGFNTTGVSSTQTAPGHPPFVFGHGQRQAPDGPRIAAFWASVIVNNEWVAAHGPPAPISAFGTDVDVPWPGGKRTGETITAFLKGQDLDGRTPIAFVAKASTLVERICSVTAIAPNGLAPDTYNTLDQRTRIFQAALPAYSAASEQDTRTLCIAHSLTDLALIRLHHTHPQVPGARQKALAAAERIAALMRGVPAQGVEPVFGAVCAAAHATFIAELGILRTGPPALATQYRAAQQQLEGLMRDMGRLGETSPIMRQCIASTTRRAGGGGAYY